MTNSKNTIKNLLGRSAALQDKANYACAIDCLIQAVGIMAETLPEPEKEEEGFVLQTQVEKDSFRRNLTDIDQMVIWKLGLAAWDAAKKWKAKFPHE